MKTDEAAAIAARALANEYREAASALVCAIAATMSEFLGVRQAAWAEHRRAAAVAQEMGTALRELSPRHPDMAATVARMAIVGAILAAVDEQARLAAARGSQGER